MNERIAVDISEVCDEAVRIPRTELSVGDQVFDSRGGFYKLSHVRHYRRKTVATRSDGVQFHLYDDETITVVKGGAA